MRYALAVLTGLILAGVVHAITRTRTYRGIVRWVWLADVRATDPRLYGRGSGC